MSDVIYRFLSSCLFLGDWKGHIPHVISSSEAEETYGKILSSQMRRGSQGRIPNQGKTEQHQQASIHIVFFALNLTLSTFNEAEEQQLKIKFQKDQ